jgi:maltose-binding protein MalE
MHQAKPIGVPALIALYEKMAKDNPLLRQMKVSVDYGQIMPNIPQMGRYFSSVGTALQIATNGEASPQAALQEPRRTCVIRKEMKIELLFFGIGKHFTDSLD